MLFEHAEGRKPGRKPDIYQSLEQKWMALDAYRSHLQLKIIHAQPTPEVALEIGTSIVSWYREVAIVRGARLAQEFIQAPPSTIMINDIEIGGFLTNSTPEETQRMLDINRIVTEKKILVTAPIVVDMRHGMYRRMRVWLGNDPAHLVDTDQPTYKDQRMAEVLESLYPLIPDVGPKYETPTPSWRNPNYAC